MQIVLLSSLLIMQIAAGAVGREVAAIDLTAATAAEPAHRRVFEFRALTHGVDPSVKRWPVRVTVLDAVSDASAPDRVIFDLRIEALQTVTLPRSQDLDTVDPNPAAAAPSFRELRFRLKVDGSNPGVGQTMSAQFLCGSSLAPGSLVTLQAGDSIRVRAASHIGELRRWLRPGSPGRVRVLVQTYEGSLAMTDVLSENAVEIRPSQP